MAEEIRGLTIEIGADDTKIKRSFADLNKEASAYQSNLTEINKQLKFDPTSVELLTNKQETLSKAIATTEQKLAEMKVKRDEALRKLENGEISEADFQRLETSILRTEGQLSSYSRQVTETEQELKNIKRAQELLGDEFDSSKSASKQLEEALKNVNNAENDLESDTTSLKDELTNLGETAKNISVGGLATLGVGLGLGELVGQANDFNVALNSIQAQTGATKQEAEAYGEVLSNIYANNYGEDYQDIANSVATVKTALKDLSAEEIENVTEKALLMRDTFEIEVNEGILAVNQLTKQFGVNAEEAYNLLAQGAQKGLNQNDNLIDVINEYSPSFESIGFSAEEMFNILANGASTGVFDIDKLGDAIKEFGIRTKESGGEAEKAFQSLGLPVDDITKAFGQGGEAAKQAFKDVLTALTSVEDPILQNAYGVELFGTMWEDLGAEAVLAMGNIQGDIAITKDALTDIENVKYDDFLSTLQSLGRTILDEIVTPIANDLMPILNDLGKRLLENKDYITGFYERFKEFASYIIENADIITALIIGITTALGVFKTITYITSVVEAINKFKTANDALTISQAALNVVMNANPIALLITLIAGLIAALVAFYYANEEFREKVNEIFAQIWEVIKQTIDVFLEFFNKVKEKLIEFAKDHQEAIDSIILLFKALWEILLRTIGYIIEFVALAKEELTKFYTEHKETIDKIVEILKLLWEGLLSTIGFFVEAVISIAEELAKFVKNNQESIDKVIQFFKNLWETIRITVEKIIGFVLIVKEKIEGLVEIFKTNFNKIKETFLILKEGFDEGLLNIKEFYDTLVGKLEDIKTSFVTIFTSIRDTIKSVIDAITTYFSSAISGITGTIETISKTISGLVDKAKGLGTSVIDTVTGITGTEKQLSNVNNTSVNSKTDSRSFTNNISFSGTSTPDLRKLAKMVTEEQAKL